MLADVSELKGEDLTNADVVVEREGVWQRTTNLRAKELQPSLTARASGAPLVVHRTPAGMALTDRTSKGIWRTTEVVSERGRPFAMVDGSDTLHVFLTAEGACPR